MLEMNVKFLRHALKLYREEMYIHAIHWCRVQVCLHECRMKRNKTKARVFTRTHK